MSTIVTFDTIIGGSFRIKTKIKIAFTPTMLHSTEAEIWIRFARQETSAGARRYARRGETIILRLATALGRRMIRKISGILPGKCVIVSFF